MIKMKKTTLIISALLALNVSHNANSEPEKSTPAPAAETAPAPQHQPRHLRTLILIIGVLTLKILLKIFNLVTISTAMSTKAGWIRQKFHKACLALIHLPNLT